LNIVQVIPRRVLGKIYQAIKPDKEDAMKKTAKEQPPQPAAAKKGLLDQVGAEIKEDLKTTPQVVTEAIVQDAKQAVNYEIRKGFRSLLNDIFFKKR
jgi:hypothetical protein